MASYTKTFYATDSYNDQDRIYTDPPYDYFTPQRYEDTLYISYQLIWFPTSSSWGTFRNIPSLMFDLSSISKGKRVTDAKLYLYGRSSYDKTIETYGSGPFKIQSGWFSVSVQAQARYIFWQHDDAEIGYGRIYSSRSPYTPYLIVEYEDAPPKQPSSLFPNKTNIDARMPIKFTWKYESDDNQTQTKYEIQYSIDNKVSWTTVVGSTSNKFHDFPPDTFPTTGTIHWRVRTTDGNGLVSPWAETYFNTAIIPQKAPLVISPTTGYLDGSEEIEFSWRFIGGADYDVQSKFDLDYSSNEGETWTTITQETNMQSYTAPPNTFPSDSYAWRVRTYNAFGEVSPYSEIAKFNIISEPPIPQIQSVTNVSRPLVTWISSEQQAYELQIIQNGNVVVDTGVVPSLSKQHKVTKYLQDGTYTAYLKITNKYNLNSNWAEYKFTINTRQDKPPKPILSIYENEYGVTLVTTSTGVKNAVYRDNELIGYMSNGLFVDYTGSNNQLYKYFIRSITVDDNFTDSDIKLAKCSFVGNTLAIAQSPGEYIKLNVNLNNPPTKVNDISNQGALTYFVGRQYPVVEYSDFKTYNKQLTFLLQTKKQLSKLIDVINAKQTLIYRDQDGEVIYGIVLGINYEKVKFGYIVNFNINKVDYAGGIDD